MFKKVPPKLSIPIFYILTILLLIYRFLFGNIYGIFILCVTLYYLSESLLGITPLSFHELINWISNQSEIMKVAILSSFITVIGFMMAYMTAISSLKKQFLTNLKMQAASELTAIFSECSHLASQCKIYAIAIIEAKEKILKGCSTQDAEFLANYYRTQGILFKQNRDRFISLVNEGYRSTGKYGSLMISHPKLKADLDSAINALRIITDKLWILVPFDIEGDTAPIQSFIEQVNDVKCNELINTVTNKGSELDYSYGGINGLLMSPVVNFNFWQLFYMFKNKNNLKDIINKRYNNSQKNV